MAISTIATALTGWGVSTGVATLAATALQAGVIGGVVNEVTGAGSFGEGFLIGGLTGGAEWLVSGALGAIAPSMSAFGNAVASSAIVAAGAGALMGQDWLKAGLIGGASAGIFYAAMDFASKFVKPSGAKPGALVADKSGNVVQIDNNGNPQFQKDLFAMSDDATKTVTIFDKAGNVVNTTNPAAIDSVSPVYKQAIADGSPMPTVGLSNVGEIDGVAGTATYYTNGKATWTPLNDDVGFGTTSLIDPGTVIKSDLNLDPAGLKPPTADYTTASGYQNTTSVYGTSTYGDVNYNGQNGKLTTYKYGDEIATVFKPSGSNQYVDVGNYFDDLDAFVDSRGILYKDGNMTTTTMYNNYVDSSGMVYDAAGNPVAKLASAAGNPNQNIDWSGKLEGSNGYIKTADGGYISATDGKYVSGAYKGQYQTAGLDPGKLDATMVRYGDTVVDVYKQADGDYLIRDSAGKVTELDDSLYNTRYGPKGQELYQEIPTKVDSYGEVYDQFGQKLQTLQGGYVDSSGMVYDAAGNPVAKLSGAQQNPNVDWSGTLDNKGQIVRTNGDVLRATDGVFMKGELIGQQATPGKYSTPEAIAASKPTPVIPDITKPTTPDQPTVAVPSQQAKVLSSTRDVFDGQTGILTQYDDGTAKFAFMDTSKGTIDITGNMVDGQIVPTVDDAGIFRNKSGQNVSAVGNYVDADGFVYDVDGNPLGKLRSATNPNLDYSGTLQSNGVIKQMSGNTIDIKTGQVTKAPTPEVAPPTTPETPAQPTQPTQPKPTADSYKVGPTGEILDAAGNKIGQIKNPNPNIDYSGTITPDGIITKTDGSAINMQGQQVRPPTTPQVAPPTTPDITIKPAPDATYTPPVDVTPPNSAAGIKMSADDFIKLQNTQLYKTGGVDIQAVNSFIDQGYTPDQIIRAVENNPNGGWGNYSTGVRSMQPGVDIAPPVRPTTPDVPTAPTTPDVPAAPTQPKPTANSYQVSRTGQIIDVDGRVVGQLRNVNPNIDYSGTITPDGIIAKADGSAIDMQGQQVRPPTAPVDVAPPKPIDTTSPTPTYVDSSGVGYDEFGNPVGTAKPTAPVDVAPPKPVDTTPPTPTYVDSSGVGYDEFGNPVGTAKPSTPTQPAQYDQPVNTATGKPYVTQDGTFVNSQGQAGNNYMLNYVDSSGVVYDDFGNPAGQLQGTNPGSGIDYSGTLKPGGIIQRTDGSIVNVNTGSQAPAATQPTTPDVPGSNYVDSSGTLYDQYGNPTKDLSGNYVDSNGTVYDEFGNPAGSINAGGTKVPGADLSGTINKDGTITKEDGSVINHSGQELAPPGTVKPPVTPDKPITPTTPDTPVKPIDPLGPGSLGALTGVGTTATTPPTTGKGYTLNWGTPPTIVTPGVNPGTYAQAVKPYYTNVSEIQPQYYWGKHPYAATEADLANYNVIPEAPSTPFGARYSAVAGTRQLDIPAFTREYLNQTYQAGYQGIPGQTSGVVPTTQAAPVNPSMVMPQTFGTQRPNFGQPAKMNVSTGIGSLPPVSIPTWTKEGGLYYAVPTAAAV